MKEGNVGDGLAMYEVTQARDRVASTSARKTQLCWIARLSYMALIMACICRLGIRWSS